LKRLDEAERRYRKALSDREEMARIMARPQTAGLLQTDIGQSRMYLGDFHLMIRNDAATADIEYQRSLAIFAAVLKNDVDNLDLRQRVAASHYRLGITAGQRPGVALLVGATAEAAPRGYHFTECLRLREELAKIDTRDTQGQVELLLAQARLGRRDDVERTASRLLELAGTDRQVLFQTACGYAIVASGDDEDSRRCRDQAFKVLRMLLNRGWKDRIALETDPDFIGIRGDRRFTDLINDMAMMPDPG